jgi:hypothetical protein
MSIIDTTYINLLSSNLRNFKRKKDYLYNFSCPYCGDSSKNKNKARGYFYRQKNDMFFKCHNCSIGKTLANFLKDNNKLLYDQYLMERYKSGLTGKNTPVPNPKFEFEKPKFTHTIFSNLPTILDLDENHHAKKYLKSRRIPEKFLSKLYYAEKFFEWSSSFESNYANSEKDEDRIVIPFFSENKEIYGYQGRSLNPKSNLRYITKTLNSNYPKVYGLDTINKTKTVYITEGPFDSMFLDNAIAMGGADVNVSNILDKSKIVMIFDNEPRNTEIINRMEKTIFNNYSIVIWPIDLKYKDINDIVLADMDVQSMVLDNTYHGLEAQVKLSQWKKV